MADIRQMAPVRFHRRHLRFLAWLALAAWLFALTAGVVNACMLAPQGAVGRDVDAASLSRSVAEAGHIGPSSDAAKFAHDDLRARHGQGEDPGQRSCLKFCDDGSSALSTDKASAPDPGVPPLAAIAPWSPIAAEGSRVTRLSLRQPVDRGPSLVIRYLRLTR